MKKERLCWHISNVQLNFNFTCRLIEFIVTSHKYTGLLKISIKWKFIGNVSILHMHVLDIIVNNISKHFFNQNIITGSSSENNRLLSGDVCRTFTNI